MYVHFDEQPIAYFDTLDAMDKDDFLGMASFVSDNPGLDREAGFQVDGHDVYLSESGRQYFLYYIGVFMDVESIIVFEAGHQHAR